MPIFSIEGDEKTKKTSFLLSMPLPQVGFAFDPGIERAIAGYAPLTADASVKVVEYGYDVKTVDEFVKLVEAQGENGITIIMLPQPIQLSSKVQGVMELWQFFQGCIQKCMVHPMFAPGKGSTWVDTMTLCRRTAAEAHLQNAQKNDPSRQQLIEIEYGKPNGWVRDIYNNYAALRRTLGVTHHLQDERVERWDDRQQKSINIKTGKQALEGLNGTYRFVDVALRFTKPVNKPSNATYQIEAEFKVCGYNLSNEGLKIYDPTWDSVVGLIEGQLGGALTFPRRKVANEQ